MGESVKKHNSESSSNVSFPFTKAEPTESVLS